MGHSNRGKLLRFGRWVVLCTLFMHCLQALLPKHVRYN